MEPIEILISVVCLIAIIGPLITLYTTRKLAQHRQPKSNQEAPQDD